MKKLIAVAMVVVAVSGAFASGFGLYEPTAIGTSHAGALLGRRLDGSASSQKVIVDEHDIIFVDGIYVHLNSVHTIFF